MSWFDKLMPSRINTGKRSRSVPEGLWVKCNGCSAQLYRPELKRNLNVCPNCAHHLRIGARERLGFFLDPESGAELAAELEPVDPLKFKDSKRYRDRLQQAQKSTGERDALVVMSGTLKDQPIVAAAFEFRFMAGSMGSVVGERFARGVFAAIERQCPFVCFTASGGARMQEALYSLLQMAKTSAALAALSETGLPYISVMTDPTTGGVSASLALLGDINIAEPGALIGFAGPRVIEATVNERLPEGFQRADFLLEHGALDMIVDRRHMRNELAQLLAKLRSGRRQPVAPSALLQSPYSLSGQPSAPDEPVEAVESKGEVAPSNGADEQQAEESSAPESHATAQKSKAGKSRRASRSRKRDKAAKVSAASPVASADQTAAPQHDAEPVPSNEVANEATSESRSDVAGSGAPKDASSAVKANPVAPSSVEPNSVDTNTEVEDQKKPAAPTGQPGIDESAAGEHDERVELSPSELSPANANTASEQGKLTEAPRSESDAIPSSSAEAANSSTGEVGGDASPPAEVAVAGEQDDTNTRDTEDAARADAEADADARANADVDADADDPKAPAKSSQH